MVCPKCLHEKTYIYNSRFTRRNNQTWRRRKCQKCGFTFSTREYIELGEALTVHNSTGHPAAYARGKLALSLAQATSHHPDPEAAFYLLGAIEEKLLACANDGVIHTSDIITICLKVLRAFDTKAYLSYLATYPTLYDDRDLEKALKRTR